MSDGGYVCDVCNTALPSDRARVRCRVCVDYDSCADCHVTESVSGTHRVEHDYEVYIHDRRALVKERGVATSKDSEPSVRSVSTAKGLESRVPEDAPKGPLIGAPSAPPIPGASTCLDVTASETYWGQLLTPTKTPSPVFSRLLAAIFAHFDAASDGVLQPSEFCALMFASGYTAEQFPPLKVSTNESASPADLHELDS